MKYDKAFSTAADRERSERPGRSIHWPGCLPGLHELWGTTPGQVPAISPAMPLWAEALDDAAQAPGAVCPQAGKVMQQRMGKAPAVAPISSNAAARCSSQRSLSDTATAVHLSQLQESEACTAESQACPLGKHGKRYVPGMLCSVTELKAR